MQGAVKLSLTSDGGLVIAGLNEDRNVIATIKCDSKGAEALRDALVELFPTQGS